MLLKFSNISLFENSNSWVFGLCVPCLYLSLSHHHHACQLGEKTPCRFWSWWHKEIWCRVKQNRPIFCEYTVIQVVMRWLSGCFQAHSAGHLYVCMRNINKMSTNATPGNNRVGRCVCEIGKAAACVILWIAIGYLIGCCHLVHWDPPHFGYHCIDGIHWNWLVKH